MTVDVSVVIPVYNEAPGIPHLVSSLNAYFQTQPYPTEVIFVDDGSMDASAELLKNESHRSYAARLIRLVQNRGSHAAIRAGILHARGERVICLPADLQDPLELVGRMRQESLGGCSVVFAVRNAPGGSASSRFFSRVYAWLVRLLLFKDFPANGFDVVMFDHSVKQTLDRHLRKNASLFLQILGIRVSKSFITYDKRERQAGESKWTLRKKMKLVWDTFAGSSQDQPQEAVFQIREIAEL